MPISTTLAKAHSEYSESLIARKLADNSRKSRLQIVRHAENLWGRDFPLTTVKEEHVSGLFGELELTESTFNLYLGNLRLFFTWARANNYMAASQDPVAGWSNAKVRRRDPFMLPAARFAELLDACEHPRDRAVCAIGLFAVPRGGEISTLRIKDVDFGSGLLHLERHKTKDLDELQLMEDLREELERWLDYYRWATGGELKRDWYLTPRRASGKSTATGLFESEGTHLWPTQRVHHIYEIPKRALRAIGVDDQGQGVHTLRRAGSRATFDALSQQNYDGALRYVSSMLGHASVTMTEKYLNISLDRRNRNKVLEGFRLIPTRQGELRLVEGG